MPFNGSVSGDHHAKSTINHVATSIFSCLEDCGVRSLLPLLRMNNAVIIGVGEPAGCLQVPIVESICEQNIGHIVVASIWFFDHVSVFIGTSLIIVAIDAESDVADQK